MKLVFLLRSGFITVCIACCPPLMRSATVEHARCDGEKDESVAVGYTRASTSLSRGLISLREGQSIVTVKRAQ